MPGANSKTPKSFQSLVCQAVRYWNVEEGARQARTNSFWIEAQRAIGAGGLDDSPIGFAKRGEWLAIFAPVLERNHHGSMLSRIA
jgi:hypothetical protein